MALAREDKGLKKKEISEQFQDVLRELAEVRGRLDALDKEVRGCHDALE